MRFWWLMMCLVWATGAVWADNPLVVTLRGAESAEDTRYRYDNALIRLALDKTVDSDGPYALRMAPAMNTLRAQVSLERNAFPNLIVKLSYEAEFSARGMAFVPFPVDLGIVGYRVCFTHPDLLGALARTHTAEALRRFTHVQGAGWADTDILRANGFKVIELPSYTGLFESVARRRADLFCRGANELLGEYRSHARLEGLAIEPTLVFVYPLPRFFYSSASNTRALDRIARGLRIAHEDGSLQALWREAYQASVDFARLDARRPVRLANPLLEGLDPAYEAYVYRPRLMER